MHVRLPFVILACILARASMPVAPVARENFAALAQRAGKSLLEAIKALPTNSAGDQGDVIATRLTSELSPQREDRDASAVTAMIEYLAAIRHPQAMRLASRVIARGVAGSARSAAITALVRDGSAPAREVLRSTVQPLAAQPRRWWETPRPPAGLVAILEQPETLHQRQAAFDAAWAALPADADEAMRAPLWDEYFLGEDARSCAWARSPEGDRTLVFIASTPGFGRYLWAARLLPDGPEQAMLLGATSFGTGTSIKVRSLARDESRASARLEGGNLIVTHARGKTESFDLAAVARDSDGDGLTDIVEARFRLDSDRSDTDGDGMRDDVDLSPSASHRPRTERDAIELAIVRQFLGAPEHVGPLVIVRDRALDWQRDDLTLTLRTDDEASTLAGGSRIGLRHAWMAPLDAAPAARPGPDVRRQQEDLDLVIAPTRRRLVRGVRVPSLDLVRDHAPGMTSRSQVSSPAAPVDPPASVPVRGGSSKRGGPMTVTAGS